MSSRNSKPFNVFTDPCTCGSGKPPVDCCFADLDTRPPGDKTGFSHPDCYARDLADCSKEVSREHFISKSVLEMLGTDPLRIRGAHWLPSGKDQTISPTAMTAKVLCTRHNNALSPLDTLAAKFIRFVRGEAPFTELIIQGYELERWILKTLCGFLAQGVVAVNGRPVEVSPPKLASVRTLFERAPIAEGCGLCYIQGEHGQFSPGSMEFYVMANEPLGVLGIGLRIEYLRLLFTLCPVTPTSKTPNGILAILHHPTCIVIQEQGRDREVHFGWPGGPVASVTVWDDRPDD